MKMLFVLFFTSQLGAQDFTAQLINTQSLEAETFVGADKFANLFYTKNRTLFKTEANRTLEFAALNLGEITTVDIVNPFKISVFYKQSNTLVLLDNTLTEITRVNFSTIEEFRNTTLASTANDRRLWLFNTDLQQLELFDYRLNKVVVTFPPIATIPTAYVSNFNLCWLQQENNINTYNIYGTLIEEIAAPKSFKKLAQSKNTIIGYNEGAFFIKRPEMKSFKPIDNLENTVQEFSLIGEILYIYNGQNLMTYTINLSK